MEQEYTASLKHKLQVTRSNHEKRQSLDLTQTPPKKGPNEEPGNLNPFYFDVFPTRWAS